MRFKGIEKVLEGHFLTAYHAVYETEAGTEKVYEMVSRDKEIDGQTRLLGKETDAAILFVTDENGERLLLLREFRMAVGREIINMPAGLTEPGEDIRDAARRELFEETGLELTRIDTVLPAAYSAIGFSNEKNTLILGTAAGSIRPSDSPEEEIRADWYTRGEVLDLILGGAAFESRTQLFAWMWATGSGFGA